MNGTVQPVPACPALPVQEAGFITTLSPYHHRIERGFVPNMRVPGIFYVNEALRGLLDDELHAYCDRGPGGGFLPAVKQIANVAALPGIVKARRGGEEEGGVVMGREGNGGKEREPRGVSWHCAMSRV